MYVCKLNMNELMKGRSYRLAREISINNSGPYLTSKRSIHDVHF